MRKKMKINKIIIIIAISSFIFSGCSDKITKSYYPNGNLSAVDSTAKINTSNDELAPMQRPSEISQNCIACDKEFATIEQTPFSGVNPSFTYIAQLLDATNLNIEAVEYLTAKSSNITFLSKNSGFASFSHPYSEKSAKYYGLPIKGIVGGTDIFEFNKDEGEFLFTALEEPINSIFWDSHPVVITDTLFGNCHELLIWSSDRNSPFDLRIDINNDTTNTANTDLFYCFRTNGNWGEVQSFSSSVNTSDNEMTPFIYCSCKKPVLFYSSNNGNDVNDYDINAVRLEIDYANQSIAEVSTPNRLPKTEKVELLDTLGKTNETINSYYDERFPFVPNPISKIGSENYLYFSSNRYYSDSLEVSDNKFLKPNGGYDFYRFKLPDEYDCPNYPPKITVKLVVKNAIAPDRPIRKPVIKLVNHLGKEETVNSDKAVFELENKYNYKAYGGSEYYDINCAEAPDKVLNYYVFPKTGKTEGKINILEPDTVKIEKEIYKKSELDEVLKKIGKVNEKEPEILTPNSGDLEKIVIKTIEKYDSFSFRGGDSVEVIKLYIKNRTEISRGRKFTILENIENKEDSKIAHGAVVPSEKTMNGGYVPSKYKKDVVIHDTIYVLPRYFVKPPCFCEFIDFEDVYNKNVPYFQTGFWEVNTLSNYRNHMSLVETNKFRDASWIELHPKNVRFGEDNESRRLNRIYQYENYAKVVDKNLSKMTSVITDEMLPSYELIDSLIKGNKLLITIDAWSDPRPVRKGWYIGKKVEYMEGEINYDNGKITFNPVIIREGDNLNHDNDTLSRLRAYFGYKELMKKLDDDPTFKKYMELGQVLTPENALNYSGEELDDALNKAKIVILTKGRYFDTVRYSMPRYTTGVSREIYALDTVRRIDVIVDVVMYRDSKFIKSPCCNPNLDCTKIKKDLGMLYYRPEKHYLNEKSYYLLPNRSHYLYNYLK